MLKTNQTSSSNIFTVMSEKEHLFNDAKANDIILAAQELANNTPHAIRKKYNLTKYLPLDEVINLFEVDLLQTPGRPFTDAQLTEFADVFPINDTLIKLTREQYQTEPDKSLTDDIYKQNPKRSRSIIDW